MPRRNLVRLILACTLILAGCASAPGGGSDNGAPDCRVVVDRWLEIQQDLLDRLAELETSAASEAQRSAVFTGIAGATFENSRDAITLGCETSIESGSEEICARVGELTAIGGDSEDALAGILSTCDAA